MTSCVRWLGTPGSEARVRWITPGVLGATSYLGDNGITDPDAAMNALLTKAVPSPPGLQNQNIGDLSQTIGDQLSSAAKGALDSYKGGLGDAATGVMALAQGDTQSAVNTAIDLGVSVGLAPMLGPAAAVVGPVISSVGKAIFSGIFGGSKEESAAQIRHRQLSEAAGRASNQFFVNEEIALQGLELSETNITSMTRFAAASVFAAANDIDVPTLISDRQQWLAKPNDPYVKRCAEEGKKLLQNVGVSQLYWGDPLSDQAESAYNQAIASVGGTPQSPHGLYYTQLIQYIVNEQIYNTVISKKGADFNTAWDTDFKAVVSEQYRYGKIIPEQWWLCLPASTFLGAPLNNAFNAASGTSTPTFVPTNENQGPHGYFVGGENLNQSHIPAASGIINPVLDSLAAQVAAPGSALGMYMGRPAGIADLNWDYFNSIASSQGANAVSDQVNAWNNSGRVSDDFVQSIGSQFIPLQWKYHVSARISAHLSAYRGAMTVALHNFTKNQLKDRIRRNSTRFNKALQLAVMHMPRLQPVKFAKGIFNIDTTQDKQQLVKAKTQTLSTAKSGSCGLDQKGITQAERLIWQASGKPCDTSAASKTASDQWIAAYTAWKAKKTAPATQNAKPAVAAFKAFMVSGPTQDLSTDAFAKEILTGQTAPPSGWKVPSQDQILQAPSAGTTSTSSGGGSGGDSMPIVLLGLGAVAILGYFLMQDKKKG